MNEDEENLSAELYLELAKRRWWYRWMRAAAYVLSFGQISNADFDLSVRTGFMLSRKARRK